MSLYKLFYIIHKRTDFVRLYRFERETMMPEEYEERYRNDLDHKHRQNLLQIFSVAQVLSMRLNHGYYDW